MQKILHIFKGIVDLDAIINIFSFKQVPSYFFTAMTSRDRDRGRKYLSGNEKIKKKKLQEELLKKNKNAILKYFNKVNSDSENVDEPGISLRFKTFLL